VRPEEANAAQDTRDERDSRDAKDWEPAPADAPRSEVFDVRTPLPGTFYRSPKPGAPQFVELGAQVDTSTVIGIVETMKLMNSVYAGVAGRVAEICVADATFARQDAVLMRIALNPT
jgi:acetyl-CoA carboxylase biotin carboxyl carrier protein